MWLNRFKRIREMLVRRCVAENRDVIKQKGCCFEVDIHDNILEENN